MSISKNVQRKWHIFILYYVYNLNIVITCDFFLFAIRLSSVILQGSNIYEFYSVCVVFYWLLFVNPVLDIICPVFLQFAASDYPIGIFKRVIYIYFVKRNIY